MSMCAGAIMCDIYRNKKYCRKVDEKQDNRGRCDCRHARLICEVERCGMESVCEITKRGRNAE